MPDTPHIGDGSALVLIDLRAGSFREIPPGTEMYRFRFDTIFPRLGLVSDTDAVIAALG